MSRKNKIETYEKQDRVRELAVEGKSTAAIALVITAELDGKDEIHQSTVSRWLAKERRKRKAKTEVILDAYVNTRLPVDLEILDELTATILGVFRYHTGGFNKILQLLNAEIVDLKLYREVKIQLDSNQHLNLPAQDPKLGLQAADRLKDALKLKFQFIGVGDPDADKRPKMVEEERRELEEAGKALADKKLQEIRDESRSG